MARIPSWESHFGARTLLAHALQNPSFVGDRTPPAAGVSLAAKATARVSGGFWIADCPTDGCAGAELVNFADPLFFCCACRNAAFGNLPLAVTVPAPKKRVDIEAYLGSRPAPATRNWLPHETVTDLRDENKAHGITLVKETD